MYRTIVRSVALGAAGVLALLAGSVPAGAGHSWNNYHWAGTTAPDTGLPVGLTLRSHLGSPWSGMVGAVRDDWNKSSVIQTAVSAQGFDPGACETGGEPPAAADYAVEVCNGAYGQNGWLGLATIWVGADGHILKGYVKVNDTYFQTTTYDDDNARRHVLCQEVGHTFGLDHQHSPRAASCMNDSFGLFSASFVSPNQHDYDQLAAIYCHLGAGPCAGTKGGPKGKSQGQGRVFERPLPNGAKVVTWVLQA